MDYGPRIRVRDRLEITLIPVDRTALGLVITEARGLNQGDYTPSSWVALAATLSAAQLVYNNPDATQSQIDVARNNLRVAIDNLVEVPDACRDCNRYPCGCPQPRPPDTIPLWRMFHEGINQHLWTTCLNEYNVLPRYGWRQEGIAWHTPTTGRPVHRLFHPGIIRHHYTADQNEIRVLRERGWNDEGVLFYCASPIVGPNEGVRMTRLFHEGALKHLHTADANEVRVLTTEHYWRNEGESFVGLPAR